MTIFNSCDLVAKHIHISWICLIVHMTVATSIFNSYGFVANTYTLFGYVLIVNWTVPMTIFNSYDLVAKHLHISWLCTDSKYLPSLPIDRQSKILISLRVCAGTCADQGIFVRGGGPDSARSFALFVVLSLFYKRGPMV